MVTIMLFVFTFRAARILIENQIWKIYVILASRSPYRKIVELKGKIILGLRG